MRNDDISIFRALVSSIVSPAVGVIEAVGVTGILLKRYPRGLFNTYRALYRTRHIGPNLKTAITIVSPIGLAVMPAVALVVGFGYGMYLGFWGSLPEARRKDRDILGRVASSLKDLDNIVADSTDWLIGYQPDGSEKTFDIKVFEAIRGVLASFTSIAIETIPIFGLTVGYSIKGIPNALRHLWNYFKDTPIMLSLLAFFALPSVLIVGIPLAALGSIVYASCEGWYIGYKDGMQKAINTSIENVKYWRKFMSNLVSG